ncbi:retrovirus-related Pol polyprotein from transposon 412 [Trichonephila clavipes]|nr:retrovirus-related Pol polyprotein from transposon 412 [Trichonephila clavipes]
MVLPAGQGQVPHPSIVPECFSINQLWNDRCTWPWGHCLLSELREWTVRSAGCKCLPFLLVKSAREVPAFRFFPEKDKEEVSSVFTCNVKSEDYNEESVKSLLEGILAEKREARELKERQEARELKERQAIKEKVAEDRWVSQLIPLLPIEIAEIVAKEPLEKSDNYPHTKNLLLARFQLTPIALRDRFESHQRRPGAMWADLVFELRSYLDNWLAGMKVDSWDGFKEAKSLAEKFDHFETIRRVHKKTGPTKTWERRTFDKQPLESKNKSAHFSGKGKNIGPLNRDPYKHEIDELKQVITKNKDVFSPDPGKTHLMRLDIELISDKPIKTKPYRMSPRQINILREEIKRLLELGVIEIGQSDYTSPLILVESPNKDPRPCVDYRRLNEITRAEFSLCQIWKR